MIQACILISKPMKAKDVSRLCKELKAAADTVEGRKELKEVDEWIRNSIEVNRTILEIKEKAANATTLTA